jgi:4-amino-4-deoxychorismate lyase
LINCVINGKKTSHISVHDRGLNYGDGIFRTFLVNNKQPIHWGVHYKKLKHDANYLNILIPTKIELKKSIEKASKRNQLLICKIIITRGNSERGYQVPKKNKPTCIVMTFAYEVTKAIYEGVSLTIDNDVIYPSTLANIKHLNRLHNVISASKVKKEVYDTIYLSNQKNIIETTKNCIFFRKGKVFSFPDITNYGLSGVSREILIKWINGQGYRIQVKKIKASLIHKYESVYIANSVFGVIPIIKIDNLSYIKDELIYKMNKFLISQ